MPIVLKTFSGEIPNLPAYMLPDANAQKALYVDFAQRDLRPLRGGTSVLTTNQSAVKGVYTEEGTKWFTWPNETYAYKGPVIGDSYGRVYYMSDADGYRVTEYQYAQTTGGTPSTSWKVGVPAPTVAPYLRIKERASLPDYPTISTTVTVWYESAGVQYQKTTLTGTDIELVTPWKMYFLHAPLRTPETTTTDPDTGQSTTTGTPAKAVLVAQIIISDSSQSPAKEIFNVTVTAGASAPTKNYAFPGGVEVQMTSETGTTAELAALSLVWGPYESRAYCYTIRNQFHEESEPSPAKTIAVTYMQEVVVNATPPSMTGYSPLDSVVVYRTFGTAASYAQIPYTVQTTDTAANINGAYITLTGTVQCLDESHSASDIGPSLISQEFYTPIDGMQGLTALPNGVFAAFKDSTLYFSEPYRPHAWPYSMSFPNNIRGICAGVQSLVVTTAGGVYNVMGSHPKNMAQQKLPVPQPGLSHRSMAPIEGGVAYASNDGIVFVQGSNATMNLSQQFFSREDWRVRYAAAFSDLRFAYHDGFLIATSATQSTGFIVRLDEATGTFASIQGTYGCTFYLPVQDTLYYSVGGTIYSFRTGSYLTMDWWSKDFILPRPTSFAAFYIRCQGTVTVTVYADGVQLLQTNATTGYYRLPAKKSLKWSVRFQSTGVVEEFAMAEAMSELRNV